MTDEQLKEIRERVNSDYTNKVAWAEWTQAEKDRALLLLVLDELIRNGAVLSNTGKAQ